MTAAKEVLDVIRESGLPVNAQAFVAAVIEGETPQNCGTGYSPWNILYSGGKNLYGTPGLVDPADAGTIAMVGNWRYWTGSLAEFPAWNGGKLENGNYSTAAGGAQITRTTYNDYAKSFAISGFTPADQVLFAWKLANVRYPGIGATIGLAATQSDELAKIPARLGKTWLGGCDRNFPKRYLANLAALTASPPPPGPPPEPEAVSVSIPLPSQFQATTGDGKSVTVNFKWTIATLAGVITIGFGALVGTVGQADGEGERLRMPVPITQMLPGDHYATTVRFVRDPNGRVTASVVRIEPP